MTLTDADHDTVLDVRELDGEPFAPIMSALDDLDDGETLLLVNSFEPVQLYDVISERGFSHETEQVSGQEWHVRITRT